MKLNERTTKIMFYNTIDLTGKALAIAHQVTDKQEKRAALYFLLHGHTHRITRDEAIREIFEGRIMVGSIHRVLDTLTRDRILVKSEKPDRPGDYGRPVHSWGLAFYLPGWFTIKTRTGTIHRHICDVVSTSAFKIKFTTPVRPCITVHYNDIIGYGYQADQNPAVEADKITILKQGALEL